MILGTLALLGGPEEASLGLRVIGCSPRVIGMEVSLDGFTLDLYGMRLACKLQVFIFSFPVALSQHLSLTKKQQQSRAKQSKALLGRVSGGDPGSHSLTGEVLRK